MSMPVPIAARPVRPGIAAGGRAAPRLGEILCARGALSEGALAEALEIQPGFGCRLGELLAARGLASRGAVAAAVAEQWGLGLVDLDAEPPDPAECADPDRAAFWIENRILPWRRFGDEIVHVADDPERAERAARLLSRDPASMLFVIATEEQLDRALQTLLAEPLAARAASRTAEGESVRSLGVPRAGAAILIGWSVVYGALFAKAFALTMVAGLFALNALTGLLRLAAMIAGRRDPGPAAAENVALIRWPRISVLVPLYKEARMVPGLVDALDRLDYPRELLDVKMLVEAGDAATRTALASMDLPSWISVLTVPEGKPRTKPRALNYALDFCRGDIVGILDAEDRPGADQLRQVARHLVTAPEEVACVQCQLSYFNARENWITRCFQLEYAIWFDVLLRGFQRLGLPIPLGGTSVYFRRKILPELGGWDAHNVTEDADLGMRLARRGYRCDVVSSVTEEEANCRPITWIRQRSRWLKGYMLTWLGHMRAPLRLWDDLGPRGFVALNVLFLGGAVTYLAMPLFWLSVIGLVVTGQGIWGGMVPGWMLWPLGVSLAAGQAIMLGCATLAVCRRGGLDHLLWVPVLPLYWTLGALAAWKAIAEIFVAPYYWDKTRHGISDWVRRSRREPPGMVRARPTGDARGLADDTVPFRRPGPDARRP